LSEARSDFEPRVKGTTLALLIEEAQRSLSSGKLRSSHLQTLPSALRELVDGRVLSTKWYPVEYYSELAELLCGTSELEREAYLRALGGKDFARLRRTMVYRQVGYATQLEPNRDLQTKLHDSRLITSLMTSVFNFSRWAPAPDPKSPKHIVIQVTDAKHVPEAFRILTEGFQTAMNRTITPTARAVRSERPRPDLILFRSNGPKPSPAASEEA
jgi:hypothetical protein